MYVEGKDGLEVNVVVKNGTLSVEAGVLSVPDAFIVSAETLEVGSQVFAKDVLLPDGVTLIADEELLVVNVTQQVAVEEKASLEKDKFDKDAEKSEE